MDCPKNIKDLLISNSNAPEFSLNGYCCWAIVVGVHDCDTIRVVFQISSGFHQFIIRLDGIDAPEVTSPVAEIKNWAIQARNTLIQLMEPSSTLTLTSTRTDVIGVLLQHKPIIWLKLKGYDKYGRILADIQKTPNSKETFQKILISEKLAKPYTGGTKDEWSLRDIPNI